LTKVKKFVSVFGSRELLYQRYCAGANMKRNPKRLGGETMKVIRRSALAEQLTEPLEVVELPEGYIPAPLRPRLADNVVQLRPRRPSRKQLRAAALARMDGIRRSSATNRSHGCSWSHGVPGRY
jgi:hypothetical protein